MRPSRSSRWYSARARERRHDREARQVDPRLDGEPRGLQEDVRRVVIEPEHEASLQRDAVACSGLDQLARNRSGS